jgi:hypothetical protein
MLGIACKPATPGQRLTIGIARYHWLSNPSFVKWFARDRAARPLLSAHAIEGVAIPSRPAKLMRRSERISEAAAYAHLFD